MNPDPTPAPTPTPTPAPTPGGTGVVEFFRTQRQNAAYVLLGLSVVFLVGTIWLAVKGFKAPAKAAEAEAKKLDDPLNPEADAPKAVEVNPNRGPYMIGWIGCLVGFLITAGAGAWYLVGVPNPSEERQRSEARISILIVGVAIGLTAMLVGVVLFYFWSESLVNWLNKDDTKERKWALYPFLIIMAGAAVVFGAIQPARAEERNNSILRRLVYGSNLGLSILLLFIVLVVANVVVAMRVPNRLDTTATGFYSLSATTEEFLAGLNPDQPVTAYAILPGSGVREESDIRDLLTAFQDASHDRLKVRFINSAVNTVELAEIRERYPQAGVNDIGILLTAGTDQKQHSFIPLRDLFESDMNPMGGGGGGRKFVGESRMVKELLFLGGSKEKAKVYFTQSAKEMDIGGGPGSGDVTPDRSSAQLKSFLEKNYIDVLPLRFDPLDQNPKVPDDCTVLVVADPQTTMSPASVEAVRKYMSDPLPNNRKGKLIVLAGSPRGGQAIQPTGLEALLTSFNVTLGSKYVLSFSTDLKDLPTMSPVGFSRDAIKTNNPIAQTFRRFVIQIRLPREVKPAAGNPAFKATALLDTQSDGAWLEEKIPERMTFDALIAGLRLKQGTEDGLRESRPVAVVVSEGGGPGAAGGGRLAVYGHASLVSDAVAMQSPGEAPITFDLVGGTIDWLRDRPPVPSGIAAKQYTTYVFPNPKKADETRILWLPLGFSLLLVAGFGAGVWVIRRK